MAKIETLAKVKVPKWRPFMSKGEASKWKKEGSPTAMLKMKKSKKKWW